VKATRSPARLPAQLPARLLARLSTQILIRLLASQRTLDRHHLSLFHSLPTLMPPTTYPYVRG